MGRKLVGTVNRTDVYLHLKHSSGSEASGLAELLRSVIPADVKADDRLMAASQLREVWFCSSIFSICMKSMS